MLGRLFRNFTSGVKMLFKSPQLLYTIGVGIVILAAFVFTSFWYISIARNAQEKISDLELSSMQDGFEPFVESNLDNPDLMSEKMAGIIEDNPTFTEFLIVIAGAEEDTYEILASANDQDEIPLQYQFVLNQQKFDIGTTYRIEGLADDNERVYRGIMAVSNDDDSDPEAYVLTGSVLSEADRQVRNQITFSIGITIGVIAVIMFLFFMHSRIIDYAYLYKELQDVDHLKDDFISMASHELRTPLTVIRGYAAELQEGNLVSDGPGKEYARRISLSSERLADLVNDMLDVARIEQGRINFDFKLFNPNALIIDVVDSLKSVAADSGLTLEYKPIKTTIIAADEKRLQQVFVNIIGNAIKYTKTGSITVQADTLEEGDWLEVRVIDTGIGMSSSEQNDLFKKFYRVRNNDTSSVQGTGLGLWITKQMVEMMHGTVTVESIKGVGTHFVLRFPAARR